MNLEFVYGIMNAVDGERDPRNLLFLFKWLKIFFSLVTLDHLTEDMFEVIACYFPVDYRLPPKSKNPTRDDLAAALLQCLCAIPDFGEFCIPLALEKLNSSRLEAKLDALKLLRKGCFVFEKSLYIEKAPEICSQLEQLIFTNTKNNPEVETESLQALSDLIKKISDQDESEQYKDILKNIIDTVKGNLRPESNLFHMSMKVIVNAALGSKNSTNYVLQEIVPLLTNIYQMTNNFCNKILVLKALVDLTKCYLKYHKDFNNSESFPDLTRIPSLCLKLPNDNMGFRKEGYDLISMLAPCLCLDERLELYVALRKSLLTITLPQLKQPVLECLKALANYYVDELKEKVFYYKGSDPTEVSSILYAQCVLGHLKEHRDYVFDSFLHYITTQEYTAVAVKNMICLLEQTENDIEVSEALIQKDVVDILIELGLTEKANHNLVGDISKVLKLLIGPQKREIQDEILARHLELVYLNTLRSEINIMILDGILFKLRQGIHVVDNILDLSINVAITHKDSSYGNVAKELLANLINKFHDGELLNTHILAMREKCLKSLCTSRTQTILTISWITKALLMRNHSQGIPWLDWLLDMIEENEKVLDGLKIIVNDKYESIPNCHFNVMILYKQKAFVHISNRICENFREDKLIYLRAMGCLIEFSATNVVILHFAKILRIILLCLERTEESEILCIILQTINFVLGEQTALIENHVEDFLTRILKLTLYKQKMIVRIAALQSLISFSQQLPMFRLLPFKNNVLEHLGQCIDDKKRLVRKVATKARSLWFLIDAPE